MASIFDQYEASVSKAYAVPTSRKTEKPELVENGYVNTKIATEPPIFSKSKINYKPQEPITHLAISNNKLCMIMSGRLLLRIDLQDPDKQDEIDVTRSDDRVQKLFFDPSGLFLLVSMVSEDTLFISNNARKAKLLSKFKGHRVESVGWNRKNSSKQSTSAMIIGTGRGLIMECCVETGEETKFFGGSVDQYLKQLFDLSKDEPGASPITGLEFNVFSSTCGNDKCYIIATTTTRLYQFYGKVNLSSNEVPVLQSVFALYETTSPRFIEIPGSSEISQLTVFHKTKGNKETSRFSWITSAGIYYGDLEVPAVESSQPAYYTQIIKNNRLLPFSNTDMFSASEVDEATAVALTEFHMLVAYPEKIIGICMLNEQLVFEDNYTSRYGQLLGLIKDPKEGTIWSYTEKSVFKYKILNESRFVWRMYLDMGKFDLAREYCKDNPANLDKVLSRQAEKFFNEGKYNESALYYAMTRTSFEEITLKFIRADQQEALRTFLLKKLSHLKPIEETQTTLLVTWLVELYLNQLGKLMEDNIDSDECRDLRLSFRKFLAQGHLKDSLLSNRNTLYDLLISHGAIEDYVYFAVIMKDYERVITHHTQNEDYVAALDALQKQDNISLYYKFSPLLMQHLPEETVDAWIKLGRLLEPKLVIPALVNCTQSNHSHSEQSAQSIRYLEYCVNELKSRERPIHNYLVSLYVKHKPQAVLQYIESQGDDISDVSYDVKYALRLCLEQGDKLNRACVKIYTVMKLYEEAVALALKEDIEMAKSIANRSELEDEDEELQKKLWLRIAKHVVQEEKDIKRGMEFLQESGDLLKIEDILPFFPDFVTIDHFKDALCDSLDEYNQHIKQLKDEMNDATESAHIIRADIQETRNHHLVVGGTERCDSCDGVLLSRGFYVFPCSHSFHSDCIWKEAKPNLPKDQQIKCEELQKELNELNQNASGMSASSRKQKRQSLIFKIDELIASDCAFCGELAVQSINKPFIEPNNYMDIMDSWK